MYNKIGDFAETRHARLYPKTKCGIIHLMNISFSSNKNEFIPAVNEYKKIWTKEGQKIIVTIESISRLKFQSKEIFALIYEGISQSHPLKLRAGYSIDIKRGTLVHELCHILLVDNKIKVIGEENQSLLNHKLIDLILFDIWNQLWGLKFANKNVKIESNRTNIYQQAWQYALSKTKKERGNEFINICRDAINRVST